MNNVVRTKKDTELPLLNLNGDIIATSDKAEDKQGFHDFMEKLSKSKFNKIMSEAIRVFEKGARK